MTLALLDRPAAGPADQHGAEQRGGEHRGGDRESMFVTLTVANQLCGVPVLAVRDILAEQSITRIPLAPPEIAGSLNLRGRIVTAVDLRRRLHLPPVPPAHRGCPWSPSTAASCTRCWSIRCAR